jgi:hypothetical protein
MNFNKKNAAFAVFTVMAFLWNNLIKIAPTPDEGIPEFEEFEKLLDEEDARKYQQIYMNCMEFIDAYHDDGGDDVERWFDGIKRSIMGEIRSPRTRVFLLRILNESYDE